MLIVYLILKKKYEKHEKKLEKSHAFLLAIPDNKLMAIKRVCSNVSFKFQQREHFRKKFGAIFVSSSLFVFVLAFVFLYATLRFSPKIGRRNTEIKRMSQ